MNEDNKIEHNRIEQNETIDKHDEMINEYAIELEKIKNDYLYLLADMDNVRKRHEQEVINIKKYKNEDILIDLLEIVDDIEREQSVTHEENPIYRKLINILEKYGVTPIYNNDEHIKFNSDYDDAVMTVDIDDPEKHNSIINVLKKGYKYKDKILRYEQIVVGKYS